MNFSSLRNFTKLFQTQKLTNIPLSPENDFCFQPTTFLSHPLLQSIYNIAEPKISVTYEREKLFLQDGGHIALDWSQRINPSLSPPVLFVMHGLTGGSEMNYIRALTEEATKQGYQCVCLNSRGINTNMTSPMPFTGMEHNELELALDRVQKSYPYSRIYMVGTSFGGNFLIRYLVKNKRPSIGGLVALAPPFDLAKVVDDMPPIYQKFFVKRYILQTVKKHPQMKHWHDIGLVNLKQVQQSKNLRQFHTKLTAKILGVESADSIFKEFSIDAQMTKKLDISTLLMVSKDDPIVSYNSMPHKQISQNSKIKFVVTEKGGHLCWYEGLRPKRWYPRPTLNYLKTLRS